MDTIGIPNSTMEELHCSICKGYLSCGPVRALPDGTCICGRCSPMNGDEPIYRVLPFEAVLSKISFPCRFNRRGCSECVRFGQAIGHETKCPCRSFSCPLLPLISCPWNGSAPEIWDHLRQKHPQHALPDNFEFKLKIDRDSRAVFGTVRDNVGFLVKYRYGSEEKALELDVRICTIGESHSGQFKTKLINDLDTDCTVSLKSGKSAVYDESFLEPLGAAMVSLDLGNNLLQSLDQPSHVTVALDFLATKAGPTGSQPDHHNVIANLRCEKCQDYLVPPLHELEDHVICGDCVGKHPESVPLSDRRLQKLVTETSYPCRWRECSYVGKSENFKLHELNCPFRFYDCFFPNCWKTFKLDQAIEHLRGHRAEFQANGIAYSTSFLNGYGVKQAFTVRGSAIVLVQHSMVGDSGCERTHRVALFCSNPTETVGSIDFEHCHCKLKSKSFILVSDHNSDIGLGQLPPCFKVSDELSVSVNVRV